MPTKKTTQFSSISQNLSGSLAPLALALGLILFVGGILGVVGLQSRLQEERQDLRQQASVDTGVVTISSPEHNTTHTANNPVIVDLRVNTNGNQTDGVQLVFNIVTSNVTMLNDVVTVASLNSNLTLQFSEVERTADGFLVAVIATPAGGATSSFVTTQPTSIFRLTFTPITPANQTGTVTFNFDREESIVTRHASNPPEDILRHVDPVVVNINNPQQVECTSFTYTDWSACTNGTQTRTVVQSFPQGCTGGSPVLQQSCSVDVPECTYTFSDWSNCVNGSQTRTITSRTPANCREGNPELVRTCTVQNPPTCTYTYSDWSSCVNNRQTRTVTGRSPSGCTEGTPQVEQICGTTTCNYTYSEWSGCFNNVQTRTITSRTPSGCSEGSPVVQQSCTTGTGGITTRSCNESCSSNSECPNNYRCYNTGADGYRCRLVTNVSSSSCSAATATDLKSCNQGCLSSAECQTGLLCWNGACRNPINAGSSTCAAPTAQEQEQTVASCNQSCTSNRDCAVNLRCYDYVCRLATNPGSSTCTASTQTTISENYNSKGGTSPADQEPDVATSPVPSTNPDRPSPATTDTTDGEIPTDETALQAIIRKMRELLSTSESQLAVGLVALGIFLALSALWFILFGKKKDDDQTPQEPTPTSRPPLTTTSASSVTPPAQVLQKIKERQNTVGTTPKKA